MRPKTGFRSRTTRLRSRFAGVAPRRLTFPAPHTRTAKYRRDTDVNTDVANAAYNESAIMLILTCPNCGIDARTDKPSLHGEGEPSDAPRPRLTD